MGVIAARLEPPPRVSGKIKVLFAHAGARWQMSDLLQTRQRKLDQFARARARGTRFASCGTTKRGRVGGVMDFSAQLDALQTNVAEAKAQVQAAATESREQLVSIRKSRGGHAGARRDRFSAVTP